MADVAPRRTNKFFGDAFITKQQDGSLAITDTPGDANRDNVVYWAEAARLQPRHLSSICRTDGARTDERHLDHSGRHCLTWPPPQVIRTSATFR